jgi:hypothetical protein
MPVAGQLGRVTFSDDEEDEEGQCQGGPGWLTSNCTYGDVARQQQFCPEVMGPSTFLFCSVLTPPPLAVAYSPEDAALPCAPACSSTASSLAGRLLAQSGTLSDPPHMSLVSSALT